jgi:hypothetical protein
MKVKNSVLSNSFDYRKNTEGTEGFEAALQSLDDIATYIEQTAEGEELFYSDSLFDQEILQGSTITSFYYLKENDPLYEQKSLFIRILGTMKQESDVDLSSERIEREIQVSFYPTNDVENDVSGVCDLRDYISARRDLLVQISDTVEFAAFMRTCFAETIFSDNIEKGLKGIDNFRIIEVRKAIVHDLSVLNDQAIQIFERYNPDQEHMFAELRTMVTACSPDSPKHKDHLVFSFTYLDTQGILNTKPICCSPHTKLIRKDSNLRIYFSWRDHEVGEGRNVLIGHIGKHPY